jgi:hypothetical protein
MATVYASTRGCFRAWAMCRAAAAWKHNKEDFFELLDEQPPASADRQAAAHEDGGLVAEDEDDATPCTPEQERSCAYYEAEFPIRAGDQTAMLLRILSSRHAGVRVCWRDAAGRHTCIGMLLPVLKSGYAALYVTLGRDAFEDWPKDANFTECLEDVLGECVCPASDVNIVFAWRGALGTAFLRPPPSPRSDDEAAVKSAAASAAKRHEGRRRKPRRQAQRKRDESSEDESAGDADHDADTESESEAPDAPTSQPPLLAATAAEASPAEATGPKAATTAAAPSKASARANEVAADVNERDGKRGSKARGAMPARECGSKRSSNTDKKKAADKGATSACEEVPVTAAASAAPLSTSQARVWGVVGPADEKFKPAVGSRRTPKS